MSTKITKAKSFREYLANELSDPALTYEAAVRNVSTEADGKTPTYGKTAEALGSGGLLQGGYASYLSAQAEKNKEKGLAQAAKTYRSDLASSAKSYSEYLASVAKQNAAGFESVVTAIKKAGTLDEKTAYDYAKGTGLSDIDAERAAKTATEQTADALKKKIIAAVQRDGMSREHAVAYAIGQGLSEEAAAEIGDYADTWNRIYTKSDSIKEYYNQ